MTKHETSLPTISLKVMISFMWRRQNSSLGCQGNRKYQVHCFMLAWLCEGK